ncbi:MAG: hypothetical protein LBP53_01915 [Candidatus Peribacteria bacterium]|jgi:hypothetical protein|nr:hypothetical protein [Candidatus Peribacteria bacterium]
METSQHTALEKIYTGFEQKTLTEAKIAELTQKAMVQSLAYEGFLKENADEKMANIDEQLAT